MQKATYARKTKTSSGIAMGEMGRIRKNDTTEIVIQMTEFHGSIGIDIREYVTSERYTGWSKNGIRIPSRSGRILRRSWTKWKLPGSDRERLEDGHRNRLRHTSVTLRVQSWSR